MSSLSARRLWALCRKESYQIVRDPSSILIAFIMPVLLLFVLGYAVNLDVDHLRVGLLREDNGAPAISLAKTLAANPSIALKAGRSRSELMAALEQGKLRGIIIIPNDFSRKLAEQGAEARLQLLIDGAEPNTAQFVSSYVQGIWENWLRQRQTEQGANHRPTIEILSRTWYNESNVSRNFLVPGSIAVVMTIIGALLTSLVVAREWERGTMEALLASPVTRLELLLSKILPYYLLGMAACWICLLVAVYIMGVPFRGSLLMLFVVSSLFLGCALGMGLFLSTVMRNQFNAAQAALTAAFLPAMMLSGFVYEIASMPLPLQWLTRIIPARYYASSLQTLFQAGTLMELLWPNLLCLLLLSLFWLGLTALKSRRTLE
ncbi:ABC transporter permease [Pseudaeromonas pectinilytica]